MNDAPRPARRLTTRWHAAAAAVPLLLAVAGCRDILGGGSNADRAVSIGGTNYALAVGDTAHVGVVLRTGRDTYESPRYRYDWPAGLAQQWSVDDSTVATVDNTGLVTARRPGVAHLWVTVLGARDSGTVVVTAGAPAPAAFDAVTAAAVHACGLAASGAALCWGSAWFGEVGGGSIRKYTATLSPASVAGGLRFVAIDAGADHTCARTAEGAAYCWGDNLYGQLGDGTSDARPRPVAVQGGLRFTALGAGAALSCGLTAEGLAYCWGDVGTHQTSRPELVPGAQRFVVLTVGGMHGCGLTADGAAYCWGRNDYGQLGAGPESAGAASAAPLPVAGGLTFRAISAGTLHSCGITTGGAAYCWGNAYNGRLGTGDETSSVVPRLVVAGDVTFAQISAGGAHTCAVTAQGAGYCWGSNWRGQLGNALPYGDPAYTAADYRSLVPVAVVAPAGVSFDALSAGAGDISCGHATSGVAYCWGASGTGALGYGGRDRYAESIDPARTTPVAVVVGATGY